MKVEERGNPSSKPATVASAGEPPGTQGRAGNRWETSSGNMVPLSKRYQNVHLSTPYSHNYSKSQLSKQWHFQKQNIPNLTTYAIQCIKRKMG